MEQTIMIIATVIIAFVIAVLVRKFFLYVALISSYSMLPLLKPGYRILTTRIYRFDKIQRGDILVFYSGELRETMVKRVIGLPGDFLEIHRDGVVFINGKKLKEPYARYAGGPARSYRVPGKKYFFLGDNRARSKDSRHWREPYISEKGIRGKAIFCLYPPRHILTL